MKGLHFAGILLFLIFIFMISCSTPCLAATTQVRVARYANDGATILDEKTVNYTWMAGNLPIYGDGVTHYYAQGPVFVDDPDPLVEEQLRWNPEEDTNVLEKDMGAVKGTNIRDLCEMVGGMSPGESVKIKASDGLSKWFSYDNVYGYSAREGPIVLTWYCSGLSSYPGPYPDTGYSDGMRIVWFADDSVNTLGPGGMGIHAFGNWDWHEAADPEYWYYYMSGTEKYPTTTGLSVKYVSDILIYSNDLPVSKPVAQFTANMTSGIAPLVVKFTDQSTGSPTSWAWDFTNDGIIDSTSQNPIYTYISPGTYTVNFTAINSGGSDSEIKTSYIAVSISPPVAQFTANTTSGIAPLVIKFTDQSTGSPTSWAWDFTNDGTVDRTTKNPQWTYTSPGVYTVKLTVANEGGSDSKIKTNYIIVRQAPPVAQFTSNITSGILPLNVQFTDLSTGSPTSWSWDFNNDGLIDSITRNPVHTYLSPGNYTVLHSATNSGGIDTEIKTAYIVVRLPPFPGTNNSPTNIDADPVYEDINGNGRVDFSDVVMYFKNMAWIGDNQLIPYFDFNGNGRIDFNDLVRLFKEIVPY
jgi:PKD repeat protein